MGVVHVSVEVVEYSVSVNVPRRPWKLVESSNPSHANFEEISWSPISAPWESHGVTAGVPSESNESIILPWTKM